MSETLSATQTKQTYQVGHYISGVSLNTPSTKLPIYNPARGELIGEVCVASPDVVDKAVAAAKAALPSWSATTPLQRAKILFRFKQLLDQSIEDLAAIVTREHGKTLEEARGSIQRGIDVVDFCCNIPNHLKGTFSANVAPGMDTFTLQQPLGVCAGITPFNFPGMIPLWMFPMAIACGNTFILKPSEKDPSCALKLVQLAEEAGVPKGVVNIVNGDKVTVDALLHHPDIQAISFVGSSAVAKYVQQTAVEQHKRVQAFGGAKNHCVIMPDADLEQAAEAIVASAYNCAGERCMAISMVLAVGDDVADGLIAALKPRIAALKVGAGDANDSTMGPLITAEHLKKVQGYIESGKAEGAKLVFEGGAVPNNGYFLAPYLFDQVKPAMKIYRDEIFGPVLSIMRVKNLEEALTLINSHAYGNGTSIYTRDGLTARQFATQVQVGMVGVNVPVPVPVGYHSFGGWKQSVFADIGMYGQEGVRFYTQLKTVTQRF